METKVELETFGQVTVAADTIKVGQRFRKDYGDLAELAESIRDNGLIHPPVIDPDRNLIAGGRRFAAMTTILKWTEIPVTVRKDNNSELILRRLELEENIRRKDMNWKEQVQAIANIHVLYEREHYQSGGSDEWSMKRTGGLLGISVGNVQYCTTLAKMLARADHPIHKAESLTDALKILIKLKEDATLREEATLIGQVTGVVPTHLAASTTAPPSPEIQTAARLSMDILTEAEPTAESSKVEKLVIPVSKMFHRTDCMEFMAASDPEVFDAIHTDPPFGIDMANLEQEGTGMQNIERIADTHDVEKNKEMFKLMWPLFHKVLKPSAFCVVWVDQMLWQTHYDLAIAAGFKVQRWPLVWVKTHRCMNQAAQYNFTKATEIAMVCRKGNALITAPQGVNYWIGSNDQSKALGSHPFAKPIALWQWLMQATTLKGQTSFDPFGGVGSSMMAAVQLGLEPHACEIDENHFSRLLVNFRDTVQTKFANYKLEFI